MTDYRVIFAILSLAAGLILLIIAARHFFAKKTVASVRRKRGLTALTYGTLFLIAGVVLWTRHNDQSAYDTVIPPVTHEQISTESSPAPEEQQLANKNAPVVADSLVDAKKAVAQGEQQKNKIDQSSSLAHEHETVITPRSSSTQQVLIRMPESEPPVQTIAAKSPEERIVLVVNRTFSAIESFFVKYASPSSRSDTKAARNATRPGALEIRFPLVTFDNQTANLSPESEAALRLLAANLKTHLELGLEIQARVDSVGPEALNYMLTQARAAAVRDFLVEEGIPAERLIARGFGTQPLPQGTDNLIAFVVRR